MKIWIARHGQTDMNRQGRMQGHMDTHLNKTGQEQARAMRDQIGDEHFDAVFSSPLARAVETACLVTGWTEKDIIRDERIIETSFGKYEGEKYHGMGPGMSLYWAIPEIFPAPDTVETVESMKKRSADFLSELEKMDYENVFVQCHGGIMRTLCGYLEDRKNGMRWRPRPENCEIRVYESENGRHRFLRSYMYRQKQTL